MKLSWKLFFITIPIFVLFLTFFGSWMIHDSFRSNLSEEVDSSLMENQMLRNSYDLTVNSLTDSQKNFTSVEKIVESFHQQHSQEGENFRIYDADGEVLYEDSALSVDTAIMEALDEENNTGYSISYSGEIPYIVVLSRSTLGVYIETTRSIADIFEDRALMYTRYQAVLLLLTFLIGGVMFLALFLVMRNMQKLSQATRQFARGEYDTRVEIKSKDEIGRLAADFNWMANAMNDQMQRLQAEVARQENFTAAFAHELKTPLTSIIGYADTIRQMELTQEETDMCANYIYHQGKRLQSLSYKLLDMTMAEKQEITLQEIWLPDFFSDIRKTVEPSLAEKNLTLQIDMPDGLAYGDRDLLSSVFLNLIDNARKASPPGSSIRISGGDTYDGCFVTVKDEGRGVSPEELSRITEAFYMVDKSRSRKEGGAGLGLALCQKILELHHASWQFNSKPGEGFAVTVYFRNPEIEPRRRKTRATKSQTKRRGRHP